MAEMKTKVSDASVDAFLQGISDEKRRADALAVLKVMTAVTLKPPRMWGSAIVGFDQYHYKYETGREGEMCMVAFSPRASSTTLYLGGLSGHLSLLAKLGKYKVSGGCLHIKKMEDVDPSVLKQLVTESYKYMQRTHSVEAAPSRKSAVRKRR